MRIPIIGLTPQYDCEKNRVWVGPNYLEAIRAAGGIPILLPLQVEKYELEAAAAVCDGFLFTGGPDIDPVRFGEETIRQCGVVVPERDNMEELLFQIAMESDKPILGICRGIQVLNVFLGGTLYQDIPAQFSSDLSISHSQQSGNSVLTHSVYITESSKLHTILGKDTIRVNSFHHQAIKTLAPSLITAGVSADSLIEAVYLPEHKFFLGVQWHPEHLFRTEDDAFRIFKAFVDACT
ncbi:gamma-glutamyl-gamma-aminobutyrate hydrolase family protein [Anaerocolumna sp. MB42-C2]|uniref:gamma-glutamyl-gamma-aminobutyrate hydrolase family protein n=1 Tax=Anaerocolumna sp. MB42-C2 TaxID=3070997 RepID=UPI0027E1636A|nr:gamma-glutamyl-gamma-aminobutyrate hydrolase family protein [Anaerocolumna sp. MB42-C2]WMJ88715.1 gamma-glutamyl-gamma-aminobutyrate hydrolase family protein [Anaerocolumna sp. MB42-C2]